MSYDTIARTNAHDSFLGFWYTYLKLFNKKSILNRDMTIDYVDKYRPKHNIKYKESCV